MGFTIDIGVTSDPPNKVNKAFTATVQNVSISPLSVIDQLNPVFVIDYNALLLTANYVTADFLSRKYFCTVSVDTAGRMVIQCKVDVLANDFSNCDITVTRNGGRGRPSMIPDSKLPILPNKESLTSTIASNNYFNKGLLQGHCYLLTVVNGEIT